MSTQEGGHTDKTTVNGEPEFRISMISNIMPTFPATAQATHDRSIIILFFHNMDQPD